MLLAQYGHQPTSKIGEALRQNIVDGVILCPRFNQPEKLREITKQLRESFPAKEVIFDPNFYVFAIPSVSRIGKLVSYPFYYPSLRRTDFSTKKVTEYTKKVLEYQIKNDFTKIISPGLIFPSFDSAWAQITLQLFSESIDFVKSNSVKKDLLLTLVINEAALREDEQLSDFLDALTTLEAKGFYLIVDRSTDLPQWSDPGTLAGLLYLVNSLSKNGYKVILGYTDLVGLLTTAVGADSIANGWWKSLKLFSRSQFYDRSGGQRPRVTYTSEKLLNSVFVDPELQAIVESGFGGEVLSGTGSDNALSVNPAQQTWSQDNAALHHWKVVKSLLGKINQSDEEARLDQVESLIREAQTLYTRLRGVGIDFDTISGPSYLRTWLEAITVYKEGL